MSKKIRANPGNGYCELIRQYWDDDATKESLTIESIEDARKVVRLLEGWIVLEEARQSLEYDGQ